MKRAESAVDGTIKLNDNDKDERKIARTSKFSFERIHLDVIGLSVWVCDAESNRWHFARVCVRECSSEWCALSTAHKWHKTLPFVMRWAADARVQFIFHSLVFSQCFYSIQFDSLELRSLRLVCVSVCLLGKDCADSTRRPMRCEEPRQCTTLFGCVACRTQYAFIWYTKLIRAPNSNKIILWKKRLREKNEKEK